MKQGGLRFDIHKIGVTDFGMRPPGKEYDYIEVASLALEETEVAVRTSRVNIGRVRLDGGAVRVARDAEGNINLTEFAAETPRQRNPAAHRRGQHRAPPPGTTSVRPDWVVAAPDIAINGVRIDFEDQLVQPTASFALAPVAINVTGFTTAPSSTFQVEATAKGEKAGDLKIKAQSGLDTDAYTAHVEVSEFNLASLQPYLCHLHAGHVAQRLAAECHGPGEHGGRRVQGQGRCDAQQVLPRSTTR